MRNLRAPRGGGYGVGGRVEQVEELAGGDAHLGRQLADLERVFGVGEFRRVAVELGAVPSPEGPLEQLGVLRRLTVGPESTGRLVARRLQRS